MSRLDVMMARARVGPRHRGLHADGGPGLLEGVDKPIPSDEPERALRITGLLLVALGLAIIWIV